MEVSLTDETTTVASVSVLVLVDLAEESKIDPAGSTEIGV